MSTQKKILIVGSGPAGTSASLVLSRHKIEHTLIDKAVFPRDKICGDALSGKVVEALNKIDPKLMTELAAADPFTGSYGVSFFSPNGKRLDVPFATTPEKLKHAPGFLSRRIDFDHFLFERAFSDHANIRPGCELTGVEYDGNAMEVTLKENETVRKEKYSLILSAEGDRSLVRKKFTAFSKDPDHYCAGLRVYYRNVAETHSRNFIELHFIKEILPGYLWVFPMKNGICNVGIGMLSSVVSKRKINLKSALKDLLNTHPELKHRFANAEPMEDPKGWGLPLGSKRYPLSGDHFLLCGDAGSLIDPFTGEGIGNAMLSGIIAAQTAIEAINKNDFSSGFLHGYDQKIYERLWPELNLSHTLQRLSSRPYLFNFVVNKALKSKTLRETITCMFEDVDMRKRLSSPGFYLKLLMNK